MYSATKPIHLIDTRLFTPPVLRELTLLSLGEMRKLYEKYRKRNATPALFPNMRIINMTSQPSTRTFVSTHTAGWMLGCDVLNIPDAANVSSVYKGETIRDTVHILENNLFDILAYRTENYGEIEEAVDAARTINIVNNGSGIEEHPTQTLADYLTIVSVTDTVRNLSFLFIGDPKYSRTIRPLVRLLAQFPIKQIGFVCPKHLNPREDTIALMTQQNIPFFVTEDLRRGIAERPDVAYVTRTQGEYHSPSDKEKDLAVITTGAINNFVFGKDMFATIPAHCIVMHPLPRKKAEEKIPCELPPETDVCPQSMIFDQAKIAIWGRMAWFACMLDPVQYPLPIPYDGVETLAV